MKRFSTVSKSEETCWILKESINRLMKHNIRNQTKIEWINSIKIKNVYYYAWVTFFSEYVIYSLAYGRVPSIKEVGIYVVGFRKIRTMWHVFSMIAFCIVVYSWVWISSICNFLMNESGVTPICNMKKKRMTILFCFRICLISIASGAYLSIFSSSWFLHYFHLVWLYQWNR